MEADMRIWTWILMRTSAYSKSWHVNKHAVLYENGENEQSKPIADGPPEQSSVVTTGWNGAELKDMGE